MFNNLTEAKEKATLRELFKNELFGCHDIQVVRSRKKGEFTLLVSSTRLNKGIESFMKTFKRLCKEEIIFTEWKKDDEEEKAEISFKFSSKKETTPCTCGGDARAYPHLAFDERLFVCPKCDKDMMNAIMGDMDKEALSGADLVKALSRIVTIFNEYNQEEENQQIKHVSSTRVIVGVNFSKRVEVDDLLVRVMCLFNNTITYGDVSSEGYSVKGIFDRTESEEIVLYEMIEDGDVEREQGEWRPEHLKITETGCEYYPIRKVEVWR